MRYTTLTFNLREPEIFQAPSFDQTWRCLVSVIVGEPVFKWIEEEIHQLKKTDS